MNDNFVLIQKIDDVGIDMKYIFMLEENGYRHKIKIFINTIPFCPPKVYVTRLDNLAEGHIELGNCMDSYTISSPHFNIFLNPGVKEEFLTYFNYLCDLSGKIDMLLQDIKDGKYDDIEAEIWDYEPIEGEE